MENFSENHDDEISMERVINSTHEVIKPNRIIQGEIVTIDDEFVYVNVGTKSEGKVSLEEFDEEPTVGKIIDIMLINKRMIDGMFVFSMNAAEKEKRWLKFLDYYNEGNINISGKLKGSNNNGIIIDCDGVNAFLPFSQAGDLKFKRKDKSSDFFEFKIKNVDTSKKSIILSRKEFVEEEKERLWNSFISNYKIGDIVKGKTFKLIESGAIIDVDGVMTKINKEDLSWKKVFKKKKILKPGEEREFLILNINEENRTVALGLKQLTEDPWNSVEEKYHVDDTVTGEVVTLTSFGVFVELEEGIEGLINVSNISWTKKNLNPKDFYKKGQAVEVKILEIDSVARKISLGVKQLHPNPWDTIDERFPINSVHKKQIKKIVNYGIFVELEDDIDGMIHVSDISWDESLKNPASQYEVDDEIEFQILDIKKDEMKISCGLKQLTPSPWEMIKEKYPPRSKVSGTISGIAPFGVFVKLNDGIEGLVHISEVSQKKVDSLEEAFTTGSPVNAIVLGVDVEKRRLSLSIKQFEIISEKEELQRVLNATSPGKVTIGDIIRDKIGE